MIDRRCRHYEDTTLRAIATNPDFCRKVYPYMNRNTRRTLVKYYRMHLKGTLRHGI